MLSESKRRTSRSSKKRWDVFISHASEDKESFVEPLASALKEFGIKVWYDRFTLTVGDSLSRSIDEGLAQSRFGLVVLSPSFLKKRWPEYELRGLAAREISGEKVILPVWHDVEREDILMYSPPLADKLAVNSSGLSPLEISVEIIKVIRPSLFTRIATRRAYLEALHDSKIESIDPRTIKHSVIQHSSLPPELIRRVRLIRASLFQVYPHTMGYWMDGFKRDAHPSNEISIWEHSAAVYLECTQSHPELSAKQRKRVFDLIVLINMAASPADIIGNFEQLSAGIIAEVLETYGSELPLNEPIPESDGSPLEDGETRIPQAWDKEHFPKDVPDRLVEQLIRTMKNAT